MSGFCAEIEDSVRSIYKFCAAFLRILRKSYALFQKAEIQIYKHFASDVRISREITISSEKM